jgi:hypothetical protein
MERKWILRVGCIIWPLAGDLRWTVTTSEGAMGGGGAGRKWGQ